MIGQMIQKPLRIGARGSPLALAQAHEVKTRLTAAHDWPEAGVEIIVIKTTGDLITDRALIELGGKGLFTKQIEDALLAGEIDMAVHSMKDVMAVLPEGLSIDCYLPREDARDVWVSKNFRRLEDLPPGGSVGTSSLRRASQLLHLRPDLEIKVLRGNVETRIQKMLKGFVDATVLAFAGLSRLGRLDAVNAVFNLDQMLPAAGQGALGVQRRTDDTVIKSMLKPLHDPDTGDCVTAERAFLRAVEGSCRMPIAALAVCTQGRLEMTGLVASIDGRRIYKDSTAGPRGQADKLGFELGLKIYGSLDDQARKGLRL